MKKVGFYCGLILLLTIGGCGKKESKSFQGAWQMVQMQRIDGGKITNYFSDRYTVNQIKMWSEGHFIFVGKYRVDTITSYRYGVGTFTLNGNLYEEDILYHFDEAYEGRKNKIWLEIRNDTLLHLFPVDNSGKPDPKTHWIEKYIRLK
ncbi:MAG TPA: hypothetical protein VMW32_04200 [Bacteroidales bacterium]|nr:hypothetical protein [Bacteroidales bacterium]